MSNLSTEAVYSKQRMSKLTVLTLGTNEFYEGTCKYREGGSRQTSHMEDSLYLLVTMNV
jgi:hypothetical protein